MERYTISGRIKHFLSTVVDENVSKFSRLIKLNHLLISSTFALRKQMFVNKKNKCFIVLQNISHQKCFTNVWMTMFHRSAKPASLGSTHETAAAPKLRLTELIKLTLQCNIGIWPSQNSRSGL